MVSDNDYFYPWLHELRGKNRILRLTYGPKGGFNLSRRRNVMSEQLKNELAKDLGIYDTVQREGWGGIKAKDAGNMVKRAIQMAEQAAAKQFEQAQPPAANTFSRCS